MSNRGINIFRPAEQPQSLMQPLLVDADEAARLLGITPRQLRDWKDVPRMKRGRVVRYPVKAMQEWVDRQIGLNDSLDLEKVSNDGEPHERSQRA